MEPERLIMRKIIIYSVGIWTERLLTVDVLNNVEYFIDDSYDKKDWHGKPVYALYHLKEEKPDELLIIIADSKLYRDAAEKLSKMGFIENKHFFNGWVLPEEYFLNIIKGSSWMAFETPDTFDEKQDWEDRAVIMSSMLPEDVKNIVDFGCGNQRLKKYLKPDITYTGLDYVSRGSETIVCDVNKQTLPLLSTDCAYMAGFVMYISDLENFFSQLSKQKIKYILFDYLGRETYNLFDIYNNRNYYSFRENYKSSWELIKIVADNHYKLKNVSGKGSMMYYLFELYESF